MAMYHGVMTLPVTAEQVPLEADPSGAMRVVGTRVPLGVVVEAFGAGASLDEITLSYPSLGLADVYAVITYYLRHRAEVEAYIASQAREAAEARARYGVDEASRQLRARLPARHRSSCTLSAYEFNLPSFHALLA